MSGRPRRAPWSRGWSSSSRLSHENHGPAARVRADAAGRRAADGPQHQGDALAALHDWLAGAAGARQPDQLQIQQVQSLEDGTGAMLRAAARGCGRGCGCGQTLAGRTAFDPGAHPRLGTRSFDAPLLHDIVLMWTAESERDVVHDLGASSV